MGLFGGSKKKGYAGYYDPNDPTNSLSPIADVPELRWMEGGDFKAKDALGVFLASLGDGLDRAGGGQGGFFDDTMASRSQRMQAQQRAAAENQQRAQVANAMRAQGMTPEQVTMATNGMGQFIPQAPEPTAMEKNVEAWRRMTPEQRTAYEQMQEAQSGPIALNLGGDRYFAGSKSAFIDAVNAWGGGGQNLDNTPTIEDGYQYTPGAGGRRNQANWKKIGGQTAIPSGGFR